MGPKEEIVRRWFDEDDEPWMTQERAEKWSEAFWAARQRDEAAKAGTS